MKQGNSCTSVTLKELNQNGFLSTIIFFTHHCFPHLKNLCSGLLRFTFRGNSVKVNKCIYGTDINLNITFKLWMASKVETYLKDPKS